MSMFEGPTGPICPSCADYVHGDCALWGQADLCTCSCEKRCRVRHPSKRLNYISCGLPRHHQGEHIGFTPFSAKPSRMQDCLCGYMGSPGHRCSLTMASLKVTVEDGSGHSVVIQTD